MNGRKRSGSSGVPWRRILFVLSLSFLCLIGIVTIPFFKRFATHGFSYSLEDWINTANYFSSVIGLVIALYSLIVTIIIAWALSRIESQRSNDRLFKEVTPLPSWTFSKHRIFYGDEEYIYGVDLVLSNQGLGPMVLESVKLLNNSMEVDIRDYLRLVAKISNRVGVNRDEVSGNSTVVGSKDTFNYLSLNVGKDVSELATGKLSDLKLINDVFSLVVEKLETCEVQVMYRNIFKHQYPINNENVRFQKDEWLISNNDVPQ